MHPPLVQLHVILVLVIGCLLGAPVTDETFLLQKQMLTNAHLSVLGCRFLTLQFYASEFDSFITIKISRELKINEIV
jgi:hypothetical protein